MGRGYVERWWRFGGGREGEGGGFGNGGGEIEVAGAGGKGGEIGVLEGDGRDEMEGLWHCGGDIT